MDLKLVKKDKEKVSFTVKGTNPAFVNTLRRLIMTEVPTMAIKQVSFVTNTSAMYDEMIAHRLGLVVLKTDLAGYDEYEQGQDLSASNSVDITLQAEGPCTVYAEQLQIRDPKIKPVHPKTIIAKLAKGQGLTFEAKAVLGRGKGHVKHSPGHVYYQGYPSISGDVSKLDRDEVHPGKEEKDFVVFIEPWGQLTPKEMVDKAFDAMDSKLDEFAKALKKAK